MSIDQRLYDAVIKLDGHIKTRNAVMVLSYNNHYLSKCDFMSLASVERNQNIDIINTHKLITTNFDRDQISDAISEMLLCETTIEMFS